MRDDAGDLGGGVELALALAALGGEVAHEVFVGVAQDVVALGAVLAEVERLVFEDGDQVGEAVHHFLAAAELGGVVEVGHVGQLVGIGQRSDDLLVDLVADVGLAFERHHVLEAGAFGNGDGGVGDAGVLVADVLDEEQDEDVVLVLAGVHAAAEFVATGPERAVEFRFLEGHVQCSKGASRFGGRAFGFQAAALGNSYPDRAYFSLIAATGVRLAHGLFGARPVPSPRQQHPLHAAAVAGADPCAALPCPNRRGGCGGW